MFSISIFFHVLGSVVCWVRFLGFMVLKGGRKSLWNEVGDLFGFCGPFWCLVGDFNVIRSPFEELPGGKVTRSMRQFNEVIEGCTLFDPFLVNGNFT